MWGEKERRANSDDLSKNKMAFYLFKIEEFKKIL